MGVNYNWLKRFKDFIFPQGDEDFKDDVENLKDDDVEKSRNDRWLYVTQSYENRLKFREFFRSEYPTYVKKFDLGGFPTFGSDFEKIRKDFKDDVSIWEKFDKWNRTKVREVYNLLLRDFSKSPYNDKSWKPSSQNISGKRILFLYTFDNGDNLRFFESGGEYKITHKHVEYELDGEFKSKFSILIDTILNNSRERDPVGDSAKLKYDRLKSEIARMEQYLMYLANYENESEERMKSAEQRLKNYKRALKNMKDKYQFENIKKFDDFNHRVI